MATQQATDCDSTSTASAVSPRANALDAAVALAVGANLCRDVDGILLLPSFVVVALQLPLFGVVLLQLLLARGPRSHSKLSAPKFVNRVILLTALGTSAAVALLRGDVTVGLLAFVLFAVGCRLRAYGAHLLAFCEQQLDAPATLIRRLAPIWLITTLIIGGMLALPCATNPGVPDYKYDMFGHIAACVQTAVSVACLQGSTALDVQGDLQPFGQVLLLALLQLSGAVFAIIALALVRPFLARPPTVRRVLSIAFMLQFFGAVVLFMAWKDGDTPTTLSRVWWSLVHSASALWNGGITLSPSGLAEYLDVPTVFLVITALAVIGSLGIPIVMALLQRAPNETEVTNTPLRGNLPTIEALLAFHLLAITTIGLVWFEQPTGPFASNRPALPFEVDQSQSALQEMGGPARWQAAVYTSATARSAGMSSVPVSQGTLSWASVGLMFGNMLIGGGLASTGGGLRATALILLFVALFGRKSRAAFPALPTARRLLFAIVIWLAFNGFSAAVMLLLVDAAEYAIAFDTLAAANSNGYATGLAPYLSPPAKLTMSIVLIIGRWLPLFMWCWLMQGFFTKKPRVDRAG